MIILLCYIVDMIANITQTILSYNKNEFMPVYRDGHIENTDEFIRYKIRTITRPLAYKIDALFIHHKIV